MSDLTIRPYEDRDEEGFYSVMSLTYNNGDPIAADRRTSPHNRFVAELAGEIVGVYTALDMTSTRGPSTYRAAGIAGVGVSPDVRRGGVGVRMMQWSVAEFRRMGVPIASLYAYREPFYAKSGYVICGKRVRISVPIHRLPKVDSNLPIRRLRPSAWEELAVCYNQFAHARSGANIRSQPMWQRVLGESKELTIYAAGDPVEGYVAVSHQVAFWEEQWLSEVVWSTKRGYEACLAVMHQIGINKTAVAWFEPSDSPYYSFYMDQGVKTELARPAMFRVCDVVAALEGLQTKATGSFSIEIEDAQVPENCGPFQVTFSPGSVSVEPMSGENPDLRMHIGAFTQAFMGEPSLEELAGFEAVTVNSQAGLESAQALLPALPVYNMDFF